MKKNILTLSVFLVSLSSVALADGTASPLEKFVKEGGRYELAMTCVPHNEPNSLGEIKVYTSSAVVDQDVETGRNRRAALLVSEKVYPAAVSGDILAVTWLDAGAVNPLTIQFGQFEIFRLVGNVGTVNLGGVSRYACQLIAGR